MSARMPAWRAAVALAAFHAAAAAWAAPVTHTVTIERMVFTPAEVVAHPGDRVVWVNRDPFPHTATATASPRAFDSGPLGPGKSWSWRASAAGEYDYECTLHTTMKARVTIR